METREKLIKEIIVILEKGKNPKLIEEKIDQLIKNPVSELISTLLRIGYEIGKREKT